MSANAWRHVPCNLCGADSYKKIFVDTLSRQGQIERFDIVQCRRCGLMYNNPIDTRGIGYSFDDVPLEQAQWELAMKRGIYEYALQRLHAVQGNASGKYLLDIGCGCGAFLDLARQHGYAVSGIEMSASQVSHARGHLHLDVTHADTVAVLLPGKEGYFDAVTMWDVLEHMVNAKEAVAAVYRLLKPGGILMIKIPNSCFQLLKAHVCRLVFPSMGKVLGAGDHVIHFTRSTISRLLRDCGFRILMFENSQLERSRHSPLSIFRDGYYALARVMERITGLHIGNYYFIAARKETA